jgi:[acyl-carrier-protein] S-malonyltransferase
VIRRAISNASLAGWSLVPPGRVDVLAGHSLGELSALTAAGVIDEASGLRLAALRGRLMERAAEEAAGEGGMLALSVNRDVGAALARGFGLTVATDNSPHQVVLSGERDWLEVLAEDSRPAGYAPSCCRSRARSTHPRWPPCAKPPCAKNSRALERTPVREPRIPVFSCMSAAPMDDPRCRLHKASRTASGGATRLLPCATAA